MMKFSEAMRLGAMQGSQLFGVLFNEGSNDSCAMGSVILATGLRKSLALDPRTGLESAGRSLTALKALMPIENTRVNCPACQDKWWSLSTPWNIIVHLNNGHKWPREKIADWAETAGFDFEVVPEPMTIETKIKEKEEVHA